MESEYAKTAAAASDDSMHSRRDPSQDPVRPAERREVGEIRGGEHRAATHQEPV